MVSIDMDILFGVRSTRYVYMCDYHYISTGLPIQPKTWTCRTMLAFWWLASLTLIATFTGSLVALFAVEKISMPFDCSLIHTIYY